MQTFIINKKKKVHESQEYKWNMGVMVNSLWKREITCRGGSFSLTLIWQSPSIDEILLRIHTRTHTRKNNVEHTISGGRARARWSQVAAAVRAAEPGCRAEGQEAEMTLLLFLYGPTRLRCPYRICHSSMEWKDKKKKWLLQKLTLLISSSSCIVIVLCGVDASRKKCWCVLKPQFQ